MFLQFSRQVLRIKMKRFVVYSLEISMHWFFIIKFRFAIELILFSIRRVFLQCLAFLFVDQSMLMNEDNLQGLIKEKMLQAGQS